MTPVVARVAAAALLLLWPAWLNGYPLVFSDTGTYLSQVPHHHLGWDRPPFYSAFLLALSWERTTWTVVAAQAVATAWVLDATRRTLLPRAPGWFTPLLAAVLSVLTALPWVVSQLMPDVFTGLLVLALIVLALAKIPRPSLSPAKRGGEGDDHAAPEPQRASARERAALVLFASFAITAHLSHVPLAIVLVVVLAGARLSTKRSSRGRWTWLFAPVPVAVVALVGLNLASRHTVSVAPYGNVFLLARILSDGPGRDALAANCPGAGWRLCAWRHRLPPTADDFLWQPDSPLNLAGGPLPVSAEADAIIGAAWRAEPVRMGAAMLRNTAAQLAGFGTGDGLQAWPATVTPWIAGDFPAGEQRAYAAARQTNGQVLVPDWLVALHVAASLAGCAVSLLMLPSLLRRRETLGLATVAALLALIMNAFVTGALSGPHPRYQSRIMWLPVLTATLCIAERRRAWR